MLESPPLLLLVSILLAGRPEIHILRGRLDVGDAVRSREIEPIGVW
jgi:hypothetical protein